MDVYIRKYLYYKKAKEGGSIPARATPHVLVTPLEAIKPPHEKHDPDPNLVALVQDMFGGYGVLETQLPHTTQTVRDVLLNLPLKSIHKVYKASMGTDTYEEGDLLPLISFLRAYMKLSPPPNTGALEVRGGGTPCELPLSDTWKTLTVSEKANVILKIVEGISTTLSLGQPVPQRTLTFKDISDSHAILGLLGTLNEEETDSLKKLVDESNIQVPEAWTPFFDFFYESEGGQRRHGSHLCDYPGQGSIAFAIDVKGRTDWDKYHYPRAYHGSTADSVLAIATTNDPQPGISQIFEGTIGDEYSYVGGRESVKKAIVGRGFYCTPSYEEGFNYAAEHVVGHLGSKDIFARFALFMAVGSFVQCPYEDRKYWVIRPEHKPDTVITKVIVCLSREII